MCLSVHMGEEGLPASIAGGIPACLAAGLLGVLPDPRGCPGSQPRGKFRASAPGAHSQGVTAPGG